VNETEAEAEVKVMGRKAGIGRVPSNPEMVLYRSSLSHAPVATTWAASKCQV